MTKAYIREIFTSIQGEGPYVGEEQLFIRFCGCNLNCAYCDTDFDLSKSTPYTPQELLAEIKSTCACPVISLTGGEPLLSADFLKEFLPAVKEIGATVYLETNATLPANLKKIIDYVDIISADIKLESATGESISANIFDEFFKTAKSQELFAKIVFNEKIREDEILSSLDLAKKHDILLILQPEMNGDKFTASSEFCEHVFKRFRAEYKKVRLIPQVHKYLSLR